MPPTVPDIYNYILTNVVGDKILNGYNQMVVKVLDLGENTYDTGHIYNSIKLLNRKYYLCCVHNNRIEQVYY